MISAYNTWRVGNLVVGDLVVGILVVGNLVVWNLAVADTAIFVHAILGVGIGTRPVEGRIKVQVFNSWAGRVGRSSMGRRQYHIAGRNGTWRPRR
jgi:hypothetical protein